MSEQREPSIRVMLMPRDTNGHGTIFGGAILSRIPASSTTGCKRTTFDVTC